MRQLTERIRAGRSGRPAEGAAGATGGEAYRHDGERARALPEYGRAELTARQTAGVAAAAGVACFAAAYVFYHSAPIAALFAPLGLLAPRLLRGALVKWRKERLKRQFAEALQSISSSLAAGRSVENAFFAVPDDLRLIFPDPSTDIIAEFETIRSRVRNGDTVEHGLRSFARRSGIEEIAGFAEVIAIAKRSGGDMVAIVRRTAQLLGEKMEVERELAVLLARKRFEARIMMLMPFAFMGFMSLTAPDYMAPLYGGLGYLLLTCALAVLIGCAWLMNKWVTFDI